MKTREYRVSFSASIQKSLAYKESPFKPDDAQLSDWVSQHRSGTKSFSKELITAHLRLAMSIVSEFSTTNRAADLEGEALLGLVQAVAWAAPYLENGVLKPSRLYTNDITPYIAVTIRRFLREFISTDRTVFMPGRTFRHKAAKGEIHRDGDNIGTVVGVVAAIVRIEGSEIDAEDGGRNEIYNVPIAKETEPSPEIKELISKSVRGAQERQVIALRRDGYSYKEIGEQLNLHVSRIGQIVKEVESRFELLYA